MSHAKFRIFRNKMNKINYDNKRYNYFNDSERVAVVMFCIT